MSRNNEDFYQRVSEYYDQDADLGFEGRAAINPLLERIRNSFRNITIQYSFSKALEIGCGPGIDLEWFGKKYPEKHFTGVDISSRMISLAEKRISKEGLDNITVMVSDERSLSDHFKPGQFDLIWVYFGALNTVESLPDAADQIDRLLQPGGMAILTFVNKWYLREMVVQLLKLKPKTAFSRLKKEWGGYSLDRHLPSRCYSPGQILDSFKAFELLQKNGYSIRFPAWYNYKKYVTSTEKLDKLWLKDQKLQKSWWWSKGEYTLFAFRKR